MRYLLIASLLIAFALPAGMRAQEATPGPAFGVTESLSPLALFDALLATPIPAVMLPTGIGSLEPFEWRDSNDADLEGAIGGVIHADGDPFGSDQPHAIVYVVYPDAGGAQAQLAAAAEVGEPAEMQLDGQRLPAIRADLGEVVGLFTTIDNVLVYGMVPPGDGAEEMAESLAEAGIAHLFDLAGTGDATGDATPISAASPSGEDLFTAMAAAPFPAEMVPFEVGSLVVLPMTVSPAESAADLVGALLVRDADRIYSYPLVFYRFYADDAAARSAVSDQARGADTSRVTVAPPESDLPYETTMIDYPHGTTQVLVQVGGVVVVGNAPAGDLAEKQATAMTLAQIAVSHLEAVAAAGV